MGGGKGPPLTLCVAAMLKKSTAGREGCASRRRSKSSVMAITCQAPSRAIHGVGEGVAQGEGGGRWSIPVAWS